MLLWSRNPAGHPKGCAMKPSRSLPHKLVAQHRKRFQPSLELLEDRTLLSGVLVGSDLPIPEYDPSRILVRFRLNARVPDGPRILPGTTIGPEIALVPGLRIVHLSPGVTVEAAVGAYGAHPRVRYAHPNHSVQIGATPNDPLFPQLWGLHNTGQSGGKPDADLDGPEAWNVTTGSSGMIVAVLDTGVDYTHADLAANMWVNTDEIPGNGQDDDDNGYPDDVYGYDFSNYDSDPMDDHSHGTHVAGTIGAVGDNDTGVVGVNWDVRIMAVKFMSAAGFGFEADAVMALDYAVKNGATISNNSWGGLGLPDPALYDAIERAGTHDHLFVAAAGNDGLDIDLLPLVSSYPAAFDLDNIIAVAATDHNDELTFYSNYGSTSVDLGAPGDSILSTVPVAHDPDGTADGYTYYSGTSMAAPHVAGVAALLRQRHPTWNYRQVTGQILSTVDPQPSLQNTTVSGGRLNASSALGGFVSNGPYIVASTPSGETSGPVSRVRVSFNEAINARTFTRTDVSFTGPSGSLRVRRVDPVAGSGGREFDVSFTPQSAMGSYRMLIGPRIRDLAGNYMDQDRDGVLGERTQDRYTATFTISNVQTFSSSDVPKPIFDFPVSLVFPTVSQLTIDQDLTIADLNVQLHITHWWVGDLAIWLVAPDGTEIMLSEFNGGSGDNYQNTIFDDEATTPITAGSAPFAGSYRPESPLAALDGKNARGTWQLWVQDWGFLADGTLDSWSLTVQAGAAPAA
jgi:serine protease